LVKNYNLKKRANIIEGIFLEEYFKKDNNSKYFFDEIVIPMFELNEMKANLYIKMYENTTSIEQLSTMISLVSHYNKYSLTIMDNHIAAQIMNLDNISYWKNPQNCNFNMDDMFNKRSLSYNGHRLDLIRY